MELLLVWGQVVALGQEHLPEGPFAQLALQNDVVPLDVLNNWTVCVEKQEPEVNRLVLFTLSTEFKLIFYFSIIISMVVY